MTGHWVPENWATVGTAIRLRMQQLGISQSQLIIRSGLSKAMVGELIHGKTIRHRSPRTLIAMSEALEWHPDHLASLLQGKVPPERGEPANEPSRPADPWQQIEARLTNLEKLLVSVDRKIDTLSDCLQSRTQ
jgi:transcriptional regulator with XRE-family HTH domain